MLLCQWAVTSNREGLHRPLIVAQILEWRQQEILKVLLLQFCIIITSGVPQGTNVSNGGNHGDEGCCPEMDMTLHETNEFPFHDTLVKFLDTRAPLPSNLLNMYILLVKHKVKCPLQYSHIHFKPVANHRSTTNAL